MTRNFGQPALTNFTVQAAYTIGCPGNWVNTYPHGAGEYACRYFGVGGNSHFCCCTAPATMRVTGTSMSPPDPYVLECVGGPSEPVSAGAVIAGLAVAACAATAAVNAASHVGVNLNGFVPRNTISAAVRTIGNAFNRRTTGGGGGGITPGTVASGSTASAGLGATGIGTGAGAASSTTVVATATATGAGGTARRRSSASQNAGTAASASGASSNTTEAPVTALPLAVPQADTSSAVFSIMPRSRISGDASLRDVTVWMWVGYYVARTLDVAWKVVKDFFPIEVDNVPLFNLLEPFLFWRVLSSYLDLRLRVASIRVGGARVRLALPFAAYARAWGAVMFARLATLGATEVLDTFWPGTPVPCKRLNIAQSYLNRILDEHLEVDTSEPSLALAGKKGGGASGSRFFRGSAPVFLSMKAKLWKVATLCQGVVAFDLAIACAKARLAQLQLGSRKLELDTSPAALLVLRAAFKRFWAPDAFARALDAHLTEAEVAETTQNPFAASMRLSAAASLIPPSVKPQRHSRNQIMPNTDTHTDVEAQASVVRVAEPAAASAPNHDPTAVHSTVVA